MNTKDDLQTEKAVVQQMIALYCHGVHHSVKGQLCENCRLLWQYVEKRLDHCPFGAAKDFCSFCPHPCYEKTMQQRIRQVMRYSGRRVLLYRPLWAIRHVIRSWQFKKAIQKRPH